MFALHVLWTLPQPGAVLDRWIRLLRPGGRLVLVEGFWWTGGITARRCRELAAPHLADVTTQPLTDPRLWGAPISDERYLLTGSAPWH